MTKKMKWAPRIPKMSGGALACPTSDESKGAATLRTIREQDTKVANSKQIHEMILKGMTESKTAGKNGVKEYP